MFDSGITDLFKFLDDMKKQNIRNKNIVSVNLF